MSEISKINKQIESLQKKLSIAQSKAKLFDKIQKDVEGFYKHNNNLFDSGVCESIGEHIVIFLGYKTPQ